MPELQEVKREKGQSLDLKGPDQKRSYTNFDKRILKVAAFFPDRPLHHFARGWTSSEIFALTGSALVLLETSLDTHEGFLLLEIFWPF